MFLLIFLIGWSPATRAAAEKPTTYGMEIQTAWIPMPDGVRLAADLYRPTGARRRRAIPGAARVPALPQDRSRAAATSRSTPTSSQRGYVVARGRHPRHRQQRRPLIPYEYSEIEQRTARTSSTGSSKQHWSSGNVGMFGISWGGFNSIQMAMRNPARAQGDHRRRRDRRPLPGRRALHGRDHARRLLGNEHGPRERAARRARLPDRRDILPRPLRHRALDADVQAAAARRAVLGPRLAARRATTRSASRASSSAAGTTATATASRACSST